MKNLNKDKMMIIIRRKRIIVMKMKKLKMSMLK